MIRFAHFEYLYLLGLIPAFLLLYWLGARARKKALSRFGSLDILARLADSTSAQKRFLKFTLLLFAYALLVVSLANPQIGTRLQEVKQEGVDIFIALDVSLSMKAEDIKPNRLEKAKFEMRNLISRLEGNRIGLVVYAGDAFTQFPLTTDYSAAQMFLDIVDIDAVPVPSTNLSAAIKRALASFNFDEPTTKVLVIITDGENWEGDPFPAIEEAADKGIRIYTIGMGTTGGTTIPIYSGGKVVDFKRDKLGNVVMTKLDEVPLRKIAEMGKGAYYRSTNTQDELNEIYKDINAMEKTEFGTKQFTDFESRFQFVLAAGILLLLIELLISEKKVVWIAKWNPLRKEVKVP